MRDAIRVPLSPLTLSVPRQAEEKLKLQVCHWSALGDWDPEPDQRGSEGL